MSVFVGEYKRYRPWVFMAAMFYAFGVPLLFVYLVYRFKHNGIAGGDKVVRGALGWMCTWSILCPHM